MNGIGKIVRGLAALSLPASAMFTGTSAADHPAGTTPIYASDCGRVLNTSGSYALHEDLVNCSGDGLGITAANVTLDLNGHKLIGDNVVNASPGDVGIRLTGVNSVTVTDSTTPNPTTGLRNNQVEGFNAGVAVLGGSYNNVVEKLNVTGNVGTGGDFGDGIVVADSSGTSLTSGNKIRFNVLTGNGPYDGIVLLRNSDYNTVQGNVVRASDVTHQDIGIRLEPDTTTTGVTTDNNRVTGNTVIGSAIDGISLLGANSDTVGNRVDNNTVIANGLNGIRLNNRVRTTEVDQNMVCGNGGSGIKAAVNAFSNNIHDNKVGSSSTAGECAPNNPVVTPPRSVNPLVPPHGDLHDDNVNCDDAAGNDDNLWQNNAHLTEFVTLGGPPPAEMTAINTMPLPDGLPDYVCTD